MGYRPELVSELLHWVFSFDSWASTLISHARGMMLAATEQARHSQQRLDTAAEMAHRSSSLYLQILKGNLQPATENVNVSCVPLISG